LGPEIDQNPKNNLKMGYLVCPRGDINVHSNKTSTRDEELMEKEKDLGSKGESGRSSTLLKESEFEP